MSTGVALDGAGRRRVGSVADLPLRSARCGPARCRPRRGDVQRRQQSSDHRRGPPDGHLSVQQWRQAVAVCVVDPAQVGLGSCALGPPDLVEHGREEGGPTGVEHAGHRDHRPRTAVADEHPESSFSVRPRAGPVEVVLLTCAGNARQNSTGPCPALVWLPLPSHVPDGRHRRHRRRRSRRDDMRARHCRLRASRPVITRRRKVPARGSGAVSGGTAACPTSLQVSGRRRRAARHRARRLPLAGLVHPQPAWGSPRQLSRSPSGRTARHGREPGAVLGAPDRPRVVSCGTHGTGTPVPRPGLVSRARQGPPGLLRRPASSPASRTGPNVRDGTPGGARPGSLSSAHVDMRCPTWWAPPRQPDLRDGRRIDGGVGSLLRRRQPTDARPRNADPPHTGHVPMAEPETT